MADIQLRDARIDTVARRLIRGEAVTRLSTREVAVLAYLAERAGSVVSRGELERDVWGMAASVRSEAVPVSLRRLRTKIEVDPDKPVSLHTVWGEGWCLEVAAPNPRRLPEVGNAFLGRQDLVDDAIAALAASRLVTLCGPPGIGKSRAALRIARLVGGDTWIAFVDLQGVGELDEAVARTCTALDVDPGADALDAVQRTAGESSPVFVVFDNADGVRSTFGPLLEDWLRGPALRALMTCRSPLGLIAEHRIDVGPLQPETSRALLLERAHGTIDADDPSLPDLLARLDGVPLAIELAAVQAGLFSIRELAAAARDGALDDAIATSWDALPEPDRDVLAGLTVFAGSFTASTATQVVPGAEPAVLHRLRDSALLLAFSTRSGRRLRLLRPVRTFAAAHLSEAEIVRLRERHADTFVAAADALRQTVLDGGDVFGLADEENDLLAAVAARTDDPVATARLGLALGALYRARGPRSQRTRLLAGLPLDDLPTPLAVEVMTELGLAGMIGPRRDRATRMLARAQQDAPTAIRGRAILAAAFGALHRGDDEEVAAILAPILDDPTRDDDDVQVGSAWGYLGLAEARSGRLDVADAHFCRALALFDEVGNDERKAWVSLYLSGVRAGRGDPKASIALCEEALRIHRALGHRCQEMSTLGQLASRQSDAGLYDAARANFEAAIAGTRRQGDQPAEAGLCNNLGNLLREQGELHAAERWLRRALQLWTALEAEYFVGLAIGNLGKVALARGNVDRALEQFETAVARSNAGGHHKAAAHFREQIEQNRSASGSERIGPLDGA